MLIALAVSLLSSVVAVPADPSVNIARHVSTPVDTPDDGARSLSKEDKRGIRAAHEANLHAVSAVDGGYRAHNPGQRWRTSFDGRGFTTVPDVGGWTWGLELERFGFAGALHELVLPRGASADGQRVAYDWNNALEEWYVNDARGLEHGYTVRERPSGGAGRLTLSLRIRGELAPRVQSDGRGVRFVDDAGIVAVTYAGLVVFDDTGQQLDARFDEVAGGLELCVDERDACYPLTIDPIAQQQAYLKASNTGTDDRFGWTVSASGDTVVVGAPFEGSDATGVNGNQANNNAPMSGAVYVFVRSGTTWSHQAYLKASNSEQDERFGWSVSVSGDTVVVGSEFESSDATGVNGNQASNNALTSGAAYVFVRSGTIWSQQAYLKASNTGADDRFGSSVSVSGDTVVVGAPREDSIATGVNGNQSSDAATRAGAAYVFVRSGTTWSQQAYLKASNTDAQDFFATSVCVSGNTVVVGAEFEDSDATAVNGDQNSNSAQGAGAAYVFVRSGTTWTQQAYLKASNADADELFGASVSASGDTVVVGAEREDGSATGVNGDQSSNAATYSGAAYVFARSGTTWTQQAYLKASNTDAFDQFGISVSVSGDTVVVGADGESSSANQVNGPQGSNTAGAAGAAYLFTRSGTSWTQQAYLKASNTDAGDNFGRSVSVSGNTVVVGSWSEDSNTLGVDNNQADNSAMDAGAGYVFCIDPPYVNFCSGDGSLATACPCSLPNTVPSPPAAAGHGCANSLNLEGALLSAGGTVSPETLQFTAFVSTTYLSFGLLLKGNANAPGGIASSDGVRCADGQLIRFGAHFAGTNGAPQGYWTYPNTVQTNSVSAQTLQTPGQSAYYQFFYRNTAPNFCTSATTNWSNGVQVDWP